MGGLLRYMTNNKVGGPSDYGTDLQVFCLMHIGGWVGSQVSYPIKSSVLSDHLAIDISSLTIPI